MSGCGGCASAGERCGNGLEKIYPTTAVRYGRMRHIGEFSHHPDMRFTCGGKVVIATDRGIELGDQVSLTCFGCDKSVTREQMRAYAEASGGEAVRFKAGKILREATPEDLTEWKHIQDNLFDKLQTCRRFAEELGLEMKVVDVEHLFGGERIVFYFMADGRVDFRELVRRLAGEFQTRIEMRQVGARDEARLLADYETCGRECCCKSFLKTLKPVSMQMAKMQKATLDPSKVSGRCGRLKCCLRFEHESYESLDRRLPHIGTWIATAHGNGEVIDRQILTQLVKIRTEEGKIVSVVAEDIQQTNLQRPAMVQNDDGPRRNGRGRYRQEEPRRAESPRSERTAATSEAAADPADTPAAPKDESLPPQDSSPESALSDEENGAGADGSAVPEESQRRRRRRRSRRRRNPGDRPEAGPTPEE